MFLVYDLHSRNLYLKQYKEIPLSLSATAKLYNKPIFTIVMVVLSIGLLPCWLILIPKYQFLAFISCTGLLFVGATPNYNKGILERIIHFSGAYIGSIASILVMILNECYLGLIAIPIFMSICLIFDKIKNWTYWFELGVFWSIFTNLLSKI